MTHPTTKLAREIIANRRRYVSMPDRQDLARRLLALEAVVEHAREYEIEHANPVPDYTLRRMIRERLFKSVAALDKLKEVR